MLKEQELKALLAKIKYAWSPLSGPRPPLGESVSGLRLYHPAAPPGLSGSMAIKDVVSRWRLLILRTKADLSSGGGPMPDVRWVEVCLIGGVY